MCLSYFYGRVVRRTARKLTELYRLSTKQSAERERERKIRQRVIEIKEASLTTFILSKHRVRTRNIYIKTQTRRKKKITITGDCLSKEVLFRNEIF